MTVTRPPLTRKRLQWAETRGGATFKGKRLPVPSRVESRYAESLARLVKEMTEATQREVEQLFQSYAADGWAMDASLASQARIAMNALSKRFNTLFSRRAKTIAETMVSGADKASTGALTSSLKAMSGGLTLNTTILKGPLLDVVGASVTENVGLIKSIAQEYLTDVQGQVMRSITNGQGLADLQPALEKYEGVTKRRAKMIAEDQTRKAYGNINKGRLQALGVKKFEWVHSGGGIKPRPDHVAMNGQIFSFDDLPVIDERTGERGIPGQAINCRCTMVPVIDFSGGGEQ